MGLESGLWCGWADPHARPHGPFARRDLPQQFWGRVTIDARRNANRGECCTAWRLPPDVEERDLH